MTMLGLRRPCESVFVILLLSWCPALSLASDRIDGRYSFSLSTFSPEGKLEQVERAIVAASLGTPVIALCRDDCGVIMVAPQALPSELMEDDGTCRFCRIGPKIMVAHSGLSADGRILVAAAQRLAIEHEYTYDESISIETFLEEISLLYQEYTMKAGCRPFGCTLLVGYTPSKEDRLLGNAPSSPQLYRVDPSGSVETLGSFGTIGSIKSTHALIRALKELSLAKHSATKGGFDSQLRRLLQENLAQDSNKGRPKDETSFLKVSFLTGKLSNERMSVRRHRATNTEL